MPAFARYLMPLLVFLALGALLYKGLGIDPKRIPSPLIDKPAPAFNLPMLELPDQSLSNDNLKGKVSLFNVWATWCVACRQEHPLLMQLQQRGVPIYGLNYKDKRPAAKQWLQRFGDPYLANAFDAEGRVGIDWGVYGTPETFVIDKKGVIRHKHIGPLTVDAIEREILPLIKQLRETDG
ncbi:Cytochrome c-type biogenesis protein CcmG/DsbE, thiol:disulfide oxidoreductase [hydrothermal vent metagenome]|uniref:Cytochrome c-type biogenesis protein CcmG/DsbE, thiol:disulfide oxidoreductase n=1 Tax=hydrothermal vent metagenome TaxID=652676 RepID=A0A3B0YKD6_9ZZZZ